MGPRVRCSNLVATRDTPRIWQRDAIGRGGTASARLCFQAFIGTSIAHRAPLLRSHWHKRRLAQSRHRLGAAQMYREAFLTCEAHTREVAPDTAEDVAKVARREQLPRIREAKDLQ